MRRRTFLATALWGVAGTCTWAQDPTDQPGLSVGATAPEFQLTSQHGKQVNLKQLVNDNRLVALVFIRSADW